MSLQFLSLLGFYLFGESMYFMYFVLCGEPDSLPLAYELYSALFSLGLLFPVSLLFVSFKAVSLTQQ